MFAGSRCLRFLRLCENGRYCSGARSLIAGFPLGSVVRKESSCLCVESSSPAQQKHAQARRTFAAAFFPVLAACAAAAFARAERALAQH